MDKHNKIADICLQQFKTIPKSAKPKDKEWTILSCIVQELNNEFQVVALGTGTKCIGQSKMCSQGTILNDSHAEVMCRRSFLRYIYDQMTTKSTILSFDKAKLKFILHDTVKFHFFTTHVPCGDAAVFPKQDEEEYGNVLEIEGVPNKKRKLDDVYRTGAKCLENESRQDTKSEGATYHVLGAVRTKPGRGDRTLSVSCSDKLAKWCCLGLQGALLSILLDRPVYLSSFTIVGDTPFCPESLQRCLYDRLGDVNLKYPFSQCNLVIGQSDKPFEFSKCKSKLPCPQSLSWTKTSKNRPLEVAINGRRQGVTTKNILSEAGRLKISKLELFKEFVTVVKMYDIKIMNCCSPYPYISVKKSAKDYQKCWQTLKENFQAWPSKDTSLLTFVTE